QWVTFHGIAINIEPDLTHFDGIVPCGINEHGVTSLHDLGLPVTMNDIDVALQETFAEVFGNESLPMKFAVEAATSEDAHPIEENHPVFRP
ncbi:MAG: hypothetical protein KUG56_00955, partial [Kordiimonadaceae bacterium]|nr:hypothetical protein [Kordiimonadaceae bacterium]